MSMSFLDGIELINKAYKSKSEEILWQQWLVDYSRMDKDTFINFDKYKEKLIGNRNKTFVKTNATSVILEMQKIKEADQKGG